MGFWTNLAGSFMQRVVRAGYVLPRSSDPGLSLRDPALVTRFTAERLWETQPHLRTVVAFRAYRKVLRELDSLKRDLGL